ncbi:reverse transcriptase domain-containing protein, partial [Tanacetum coccineum]
MMTYLKHVGNFKHSELKSTKFEDIQAMYEKIKRSDENFIAIGSVEDERLIKRMNKKDSSKGEEIKQESKEKVKAEDKEEENTRKRKLSTRKKIKSRKRRFKQDTFQDDPSDTEKDNDELRLCLTIAPDEDKEVDYEILDKKYPIIDWKTENLGTKPHSLGDLIVMFHPDEQEIYGTHSKKERNIDANSKAKLDSEEESTMALELIKDLSRRLQRSIQFNRTFNILRNYNLMDDEPMWAADHVVALTPGSAINIPETINEFAIKGDSFPKLFLTDKSEKSKSSLKKIIIFADKGSSNTDTNKIMAQMDVMTIKMDAQYKELQSRAKQPTPNLDDDDIPISNKVPPKLGDLRSFLIPCNFNKTFSCNALADLGANINLMPYSLYAKLSLETLKPTKMSVRLADRSFQYPVGIAENMLVEVVGTERMIFNIDSVMKHSYSNDDTCFSIDVIDEILEEDFDALLDEGRKILHFIEGTLHEEEIFSEFNEFMGMTVDENFKSESNTEEPPFEKITINTDYKIKTSLEEPPTDLELKPLPDNLEYVFLEEPFFLPVIISSQLSAQNKSKLISVLKNIRKPLLGKQQTFLVSRAGLEVDKAKIDVILKLLPPTNIKGVRSFLRHASFFRRFIKDFSKIARPITKLLEKDTPFEFNDECQKAFDILKEKLTCAPVI